MLGDQCTSLLQSLAMTTSGTPLTLMASSYGEDDDFTFMTSSYGDDDDDS